ncbi:MAG: divalent-cation tolerance protein CutA [Microcoleus sp. SU_5_3]|nr:divalent-cation tolerance protein CutA [Microcoleus sp. SU_5_3]
MRLIMCSCPKEVVDKITNAVVERHLAVFVNAVSGVKTTSLQKEAPCIQEETLLLIQTPIENLEPLFELLASLHPSKAPAIIALPITSGNYEYLKWAEETLVSKTRT